MLPDPPPERKSRLFEAFDPGLVVVLARPTRDRSAAILEDLFTQFFDETIVELPTKPAVMRVLRSHMGNAPAANVQGVLQAPDIHAHEFYAELVDSGWLREMQRGFTTICEMPPAAHAFLSFMLDLAENLKRSYGTEVQSIERNVHSARQSPDQFPGSLLAAANQSKQLIRHLRLIRSSLSNIETELMREKTDAAGLLKRAFEGFVDKILITDFRALKTSNNPFSHRRKILDDINELATVEKTKMLRMEQGLVEQRLYSQADTASRALWNALHTIRSAFTDLEQHIDQIEIYVLGLEKRIAITVAHLDSAMIEHELDLAGMISQLNDHLARDPSATAPWPLLREMRPYDQTVFYPPKAASVKPPPTKVAKRRLTAAQLAFERDCTDYLEQFDFDTVQARKIARDLLERIGSTEGAAIDLNDLVKMASDKDVALFDMIRQIAISDEAQQTARQQGLDVEASDSWQASDWFGTRGVSIKTREIP